MREKECTSPIFRALEKQGLRWNPETEEIELDKEQRWRAEEGEPYYFVEYGSMVVHGIEENSFADFLRWFNGDYFRTAGEAQKYADEFKRMLQERTLDKEE